MEETKKKNGFASGIGFIFAAAGSAVGLGNLWAFPYKTSQGGGAVFVLLYILCVLFIGVVTMLCEIYIGKRAQANPISAYKKAHKNLGFIGLVSIIIPFIITVYYSVLGGYTVKYTVNSFAGNAGILASFSNSKWQVILFTTIFIALALLIVMGGVKAGIEKASKILMPALFIIMVGVVIFSLCLGEGVSAGLKYYLKPNFKAVDNWGKTILAAMGQAFFSLSLGMGAMLTYGSYTDNKVNLVKSTAMICIFDTLIALLAGLAIFPAVFHYTATEGVSQAELGMQGPGLLFATLPRIFENMGIAGKIVSFFFFAMVVIAAVTSVISLMEVVTQFVIQKFKLNRKIAIGIVSAIAFALSIPVGISLGSAFNDGTTLFIFGVDLLTLLDTITNTVLMPVTAFFACVTVGYIIGGKNAANEIEEEGTKLGWFKKVFVVMVRYITPVLIAIVEIFGVLDLIFPNFNSFSNNGLGIVILAYALVATAAAIYFAFFKDSYTGVNADELTPPTEL